MRGRTATLFTFVCLLAAPAAAEAERAATIPERDAMAAAFSYPSECIKAFVSTVDGTWGAFYGTNADACPQGNGLVITRRAGAGWQVLTTISAEYSALCPDGVPRTIALDLRLCRKPRTYILCLPKDPPSDYSRTLRQKPRSCTTLGPRQSFAEAANLARLRWRGWGKRVARARGIEKGFHLPYARIRSRVVAYRRRRCPFGDFTYTRLKVRTKYGGGTLRFPSDCSD